MGRPAALADSVLGLAPYLQDGALEVAGPRRERPRGLPPLNAALTVLNRDFMEAGL